MGFFNNKRNQRIIAGTIAVLFSGSYDSNNSFKFLVCSRRQVLMENISEGKMKWIKQLSLLLITLVLLTGSVQIFAASQSTEAKDDEVIKEGIFIGDVNVGKLTYKEAKKKIQDRVKELSDVKVTLNVNKNIIETTLKELGYKWSNSEVLDEAAGLGKSGNVIKRYKDELDLKNEGMKYTLNMDFKKESLKKKLKTECDPYNIKAEKCILRGYRSGL